MKTNKLMWLFTGILLLMLMTQQSNISPQTVAPSCFEKEECRVAPKSDYCSVEFDCIQGQCIRNDIRCPETCNSGKDDDLDGAIDCKDTDCWDSPLCHCSATDFNECAIGRCYCETGTDPRWHVGGDGVNFCGCI
jgi:hypothetical protein